MCEVLDQVNIINIITHYSIECEFDLLIYM